MLDEKDLRKKFYFAFDFITTIDRASEKDIEHIEKYLKELLYDKYNINPTNLDIECFTDEYRFIVTVGKTLLGVFKLDIIPILDNYTVTIIYYKRVTPKQMRADQKLTEQIKADNKQKYARGGSRGSHDYIRVQNKNAFGETPLSI